jgi:Xaa-Pro aminopeptidase
MQSPCNWKEYRHLLTQRKGERDITATPPGTSPIPSSEIQKRISSVQTGLQQAGLEGLLVVQRVDLFYLSGTAQNGLLYIPQEGDPLLLIRKYLPRARQESPLIHIMGLESVKQTPTALQDFYGRLPHRLGLELDVMPANEFAFYRGLFPRQECVDGSPVILRTRAIKSDWELAQMEQTARRTWGVFQFIGENLTPGLTELESTGIFEAYARKLGLGARLRIRDYQTEGYPWHLLSGASGGVVGLLDSPASGDGPSAAFPCGAGKRPLEKNEPILVDFAAAFCGYHMDETRMFAIGGMPQEAVDAVKAAVEIHNQILERIRPGALMSDIFHFSVTRADALGYGRQYLGPPGHKVRFVGHGIGLELIEPPMIAENSDQPMEVGMTFALEPKLVFENQFAAGVESVLAVTEKGCRLISQVPVKTFLCRP